MRRPSIVLAAATLTVALASPAFAAGPGLETDSVDHYTQVVYELDGPTDSPLLKVQEKVVDARGEVVRRASYTKEAVRQGSIRPLSAAPFACLHDRERQLRGAWDHEDRLRVGRSPPDGGIHGRSFAGPRPGYALAAARRLCLRRIR